MSIFATIVAATQSLLRWRLYVVCPPCPASASASSIYSLAARTYLFEGCLCQAALHIFACSLPRVLSDIHGPSLWPHTYTIYLARYSVEEPQKVYTSVSLARTLDGSNSTRTSWDPCHEHTIRTHSSISRDDLKIAESGPRGGVRTVASTMRDTDRSRLSSSVHVSGSHPTPRPFQVIT